MQAIILAGGFGTRLRGVVPDLPKPMAPVGGRPFLEYVLDELARAGFGSVVLAAGYRHEALREHFGDRYRNLALRYSVEPRPLGTGGAMRLAWAHTSADPVFVLNGDTFVGLDYRAMLAAHVREHAHLTIAVCEVEDGGRYGAIEIEAGIVRRFREKGLAGRGWINAGAYLIGRALAGRFPQRDAFSFEQDVLVPEVGTLTPLAFTARGPFIDIGIPQDYARAHALLGAAHGATP